MQQQSTHTGWTRHISVRRQHQPVTLATAQWRHTGVTTPANRQARRVSSHRSSVAIDIDHLWLRHPPHPSCHPRGHSVDVRCLLMLVRQWQLLGLWTRPSQGCQLHRRLRLLPLKWQLSYLISALLTFRFIPSMHISNSFICATGRCWQLQIPC